MKRRLARPVPAQFAPARLLLIGATAIVLVALIAVVLLITRDWETQPANAATAVASAASLVVALGAIWAAIFTLSKQQEESRLQREMATLHLVNEQYERIFDDIYELRARATTEDGAFAEAKIDVNDMKRAYNRFFTTIMTGFRYYQLSFIPREDFLEWTATLIGRFVAQECIVRARSIKPCPMSEYWIEFNSWARGPRKAFRAYMKHIQLEADALRLLTTNAPQDALMAAAERVVNAIDVSQ